MKIMHYSVPGLPSYRARTPDLADARELARALAVQTMTHAAILVHSATDEGAEVVELAEVIAPPAPA